MELTHQCTSSEKKVTVGQVWSLDCEQGTELSAPTDIQTPLDPYRIVILEKQPPSNGHYHFKVTTYRVGKHEDLLLQDGKLQWRVPGIEVQSVLEKEDKGFGPLIVEGIALPPIYILAPIFFVLVILLSFTLAWWRKKKEKDQLVLMGIMSSTVPAHLEFYSRNRQLFREIKTEDALKQLRQHLLFYIARKEMIPTYYWKNEKIFRKLKKRGFSKKIIDRFIFLLHEISALQMKFAETGAGQNSLLRQDFENVLRWSSDFIENFEKESLRDIS